MRTEAGKMPGSLISPIRNGHGVSHDRYGLNKLFFMFHDSCRQNGEGIASIPRKSRAQAIPGLSSLSLPMGRLGTESPFSHSGITNFFIHEKKHLIPPPAIASAFFMQSKYP